MTIDPELKAMHGAYEAIEALDDDESKARVIKWLFSKFSVAGSKLHTSQNTISESETLHTKVDIPSYETVADIFSHASPRTESDKVLIVASFLQDKYGKSELTGREIHKELQHLGHGVSNITMAIQGLIDKKPKLMIQTRKEGKSKQAHKKYKVTVEGIKIAKEMLTTFEDEE